LGEVLTIIVEYLQEPEGGLWLYDPKRECLRLHLILEHGEIKPAGETDHPGANMPEEQAPTIHTLDLLSLFRESGVRTYLPEDIAGLGAFAPYREHLAHRGVRSIIAIPFRAANDFLGVISIRSRREKPMATDEVAFVQAIAIHASLALKMSHLANMERLAVVAEERREAVSRQKEALDRIATAGSATLQRLAEQPDFDVFLDHVLAVCIDQFNAIQACVWIGDPVTGMCTQFIRFLRGNLRHEVRPAYQYHFVPANRREAEALRPLRGQIVIHRRAEFEAFSTYRDRLAELRSLNIQTLLRVPLFFGTEARGVLVLKFDSERALSPDEDGLVHALANQVVLALELTRLSEKAKLAALADERNRMAADVHDNLAQAFAATLLHLRSMEMAGTPAALQAHWRYAQDTAAHGLAAARRTMNAVRTEGPADQRALPDRLADRVRQVAARNCSQTRVSFELGGEPTRLPWAVEDELEKLAGEALFNAERHAGAREICLSLDYLPGQGLRLCIRDDGRGFDENDSGGAGLGLRSMHDRADRIGASFTLITEAGQGTEIIVLWTCASPRPSPETR
jgi:signal transduction histidine kinase